MPETVTQEQWRAVRASLARTVDRFADLVTAVPAGTRATRHWSVADTAAHVASIAWWYSSMVHVDGSVPIPGIRDQLLATTVDTVADLNDVVLGQFTERDPVVLAQRLRTDIAEVLRMSERLDPATPMTWLGDARVPLAGVLSHLVNELLVHGWDIARAARVRWEIPPADAARFFELFVVGVVHYDYGRLLDTDDPPSERRVAVEFRSDHTSPVTLVLHRGRVSLEQPRPDNDVRLWFDPATLCLMLFGRVSRVRAVLTGRVTVRGRRPWLLPKFLRTVRLPS